VIGLVAVFAVLVVSAAVAAVLVSREKPLGQAGSPPSGVTVAVSPDGTVTMAKPGVTTPLVDVFEDFQCPICKEFHRVNDATLKSLAGEGQAKVVYHPIVIFTSEPLSGNSVRASAAAHCVTDGDRWLAFQDQLFLHQPPEGSAGFSTTDLVSYGTTAGISDSGFGSCVRSQRYAAQVRQASEAAISGGVFGTPTVNVNGRTLPTSETLTAEGLRNAIVAAA
jgi:protein-disulfide isomerase